MVYTILFRVGLLSGDTGCETMNAWKRFASYVLRPTSYSLLSCLLIGCSGLRIERSIIVRPGDILTYGGGNARDATYDCSPADSLVELWDKDLAAGMGSGSPLLLDSMIIGGTLRGELVALHVRTGKLLGSLKIDDAVPGSPVIEGNIVVLPLSGGEVSVAAYNLNDGRIVWKKPYADVEMSLLLSRRRVFFGTVAGTVYCIERITGDPVWTYELPDNWKFDGFHSLPCANDSLLFLGCDNGSMYALRIEDGTLRWHAAADGPIAGGAALSSAAVIATTVRGSVFAFAPGTGTVLWQHSCGSAIYAPPALFGDTIIVGTIEGSVVALDAKNGNEVWRTSLDGPIDAGAAIAGDKIFLGTLKKKFYGLRIWDGAVVFAKELDGRIKSPAVVGYDRVFVTTDEFTLYCFGRGRR